jgi:hypothetical protein
MTLAAPRSRQGKLTLVLAFLAVAVAVVGAFLWSSQAGAVVPTATLSVDDDAGTTITQGSLLTYTATLTVTGTGAETPNTVFTINLDDDLNVPLAGISEAGTLFDAADCAVGAGSVVTCTDSSADAENHSSGTISMITVVAGPGPIDPPTACSYNDADAGSGPVNCTVVPAAAITVGAGVTVADATNLVGVAHTFDFLLQAGFTCQSDGPVPSLPDGNEVDCVAGDVTLGGSLACTAGAPVVTSPSTLDATTVSVTITPPDNSTGTCTVTLDVYFVGMGEGDPTADFDPPSVTATKTFQNIAEAGGAYLRHVDSDCQAERDFNAGNNHSSSGNGDYDGNVEECNGLLSDADISAGRFGLCLNASTPNCYSRDDSDDAIGSLHTVCIIGGALTDANNADITWSVTPTADHQEPVDVNDNKFGLDVSGDAALEPCVGWRVGDVGTEQSISAQYDPTGEDIFSNGIRSTTLNDPECHDSETDANQCTFQLCQNIDVADATPQSEWGPCVTLVKEWNSIDSTVIVQDTGNRDGNDCTPPSSDSATCANANLDGDTITVEGQFIIDNLQGVIDAPSVTFVDYVLGSHDGYDGPIDGAEQTISVSGDCGIVSVVNPTDSPPQYVLGDGDSQTILANSDKGLEFTINPFDSEENFDCFDGECITVTISTVQSSNFDSSDPDSAPDEEITVCFVAGPGAEKQPLLAWVGQRVVLSHDWSGPDGSCPWYPGPRGDTAPFYVRYIVQAPSPGAISDVPGGPPAVEQGPDYIIVEVNDSDNCVSHAIYESQNQGRVDVTAHVVQFLNQTAANVNVVSPEHDFWYYYMKFEDATLAASDNDAIVSEDVNLTVTVRGWVLADNCPVKAAGQDSNGLLLPANRCTFPTDWAQVVGDDDQFDILGGSQTCDSQFAGPFGTLSGVPPDDCGDDSVAPHVNGGFRESTKSDGQVTAIDAPMPPAEVTFTRTGSGFLHGVDKASGEYQVTHIPAEPQIQPATPYLWHTWNGTGERSGLYNFWTDFIGVGDAVVSCPGDSPCDDGVATGGYDAIAVYSDNAGVAMAAINGDAELTFAECDNNLGDHLIIEPIDGHYCEQNDVVGTSTVSANVDYPDKKPHQDIDAASPVTITWRWGGIKDITTAPGETVGGEPISTYVIFNVRDRDGFCDPSDSLHPVLGEIVEFQIDQGDGIIIEAEGSGVISGDQRSAVTETFDTDGDSRTKGSPGDDVCQAWILVSHSLGTPVDVRVTAHDPEGTIEFDTILNPTPSPTPVVTDPPTQEELFGDVNCSGAVSVTDARLIVLGVVGSAPAGPAGCPDVEDVLLHQQGSVEREIPWGDVDCTATLTVTDARKVVLNVVGEDVTQTAPCFGIGGPIDIPQQ